MEAKHSQIYMLVLRDGTNLIHELAKWDVSGKYALKIQKLAKKLLEEYGLIETGRMNLLKKHGKEENGVLSVKQGTPGFDAFMKDFDEMLEQKFELGVGPVVMPASELDGMTKKMTAVELELLSPFVYFLEPVEGKKEEK